MKPLLVDDCAQIIPGKSAGGFTIGTSDHLIPKDFSILRTENNKFGYNHYYSKSVNLVTLYNKISHVITHGTYRGFFCNEIGIGSTLGELSDKFGPLFEDEGEVFGLRKYPGIYFEFDKLPVNIANLESLVKNQLYRKFKINYIGIL